MEDFNTFIHTFFILKKNVVPYFFSGKREEGGRRANEATAADDEDAGTGRESVVMRQERALSATTLTTATFPLTGGLQPSARESNQPIAKPIRNEMCATKVPDHFHTRSLGVRQRHSHHQEIAIRCVVSWTHRSFLAVIMFNGVL